jgi:hypothetical protein
MHPTPRGLEATAGLVSGERRHQKPCRPIGHEHDDGECQHIGMQRSERQSEGACTITANSATTPKALTTCCSDNEGGRPVSPQLRILEM